MNMKRMVSALLVTACLGTWVAPASAHGSKEWPDRKGHDDNKVVSVELQEAEAKLAAAKKAEEEARAAKRKVEEEARAAKRKAEEEAKAAKQKAEEEKRAANWEAEVARRKAEAEAKAAKKQAEYAERKLKAVKRWSDQTKIKAKDLRQKGHGNGAFFIFVDSNKVNLVPLVKGGRTMVPFRALAEMLGASVDWQAESKAVIMVFGDRVVVLTVGSAVAVVNGKATVLDVEAEIVDGRTFIPLRFIAEALGAHVEFDPETGSVIIVSEQAANEDNDAEDAQAADEDDAIEDEQAADEDDATEDDQNADDNENQA